MNIIKYLKNLKKSLKIEKNTNFIKKREILLNKQFIRFL